MLKFINNSHFDVVDDETIIGKIRRYPNGIYAFCFIKGEAEYLTISVMKQIVNFVERQIKEDLPLE